MHGGPSTGPRTPEGLDNSRKARLTDGRHTAARKRLRRQLTWVRSFAKLLAKCDQMHQSLVAIKRALEVGRPPNVLTAKCLKALPLYEQYLAVLESASAVGIETEQRHPKPSEWRLLAVLWAGAEGAGAPVLRELLEGTEDEQRTISELLITCQCVIAELLGLAREKINEAFDAGEIDGVEGRDDIVCPDHDTRLSAVAHTVAPGSISSSMPRISSMSGLTVAANCRRQHFYSRSIVMPPRPCA